MRFLKNVLREIKKQLTATPKFAGGPLPPIFPEILELRDGINQQIEKAMEQKKGSMIFLIAPFGGGKSTQLHYFREKHPQFNYVYKSLMKLSNLDMTFLHMTSFTGRLSFVLLTMFFCIFLIRFIPPSGTFPFLLTITYLFTKNAPSLLYTFHETMDNLLTRKKRIILLEDLERSSLSKNDQWALLANLWNYKRTYLVPLGYPPNKMQERLKMLEYAMKIEGVVIEIPANGRINEKFMKRIDSHFPFQVNEQIEEGGAEWLSLFTLREMQLIHEQVLLRSAKHSLFSSCATFDRQMVYIEICLELLSEKIGCGKEEISFNPIEREIKAHIKPDSEKKHYLESFIQSIKPSLEIKGHFPSEEESATLH